MTQAKDGDLVRVHYTGKLDDGEVFDTSANQAPLEFTLGKDEVIEGFRQAVVGMEPGDSKIVKIDPESGYGPHIPEMVIEVERENLPDDLDPDVGQQLKVEQDDGSSRIVTVVEKTEKTISLDANHPLAGKNLTFEIELVDISPES